MVKKLLIYAGPGNLCEPYKQALEKKLKGFSMIFSRQTGFCYQCVEL